MANAYNSTIRTARVQDIIDEAGTGALLKLYNGTRPANGGAVTSQTLIAELSNAGSLGSAATGVLTFDTITGDSSANASGTPTWLRLLKSDGTTWVADFDLSSFPACTSGQPVDITSFTVTEGNA